jgi:hypothetical protein
MNNKLEIIHNEKAERFEIQLGEGMVAVLIYRLHDNLMLFSHTEVPPAFEGKGIAGRLASTALNYARQNGFKIRSYCSYITMYIERHPEYKELLG